MSTLSRRLPDSNDSRVIALNGAKVKNDNLPVGIVILTTATKNRLNTIQPIYVGLVNALGVAGEASTNATNVKSIAQDMARMWSSHYYQSLNNAIARGEYPASVRQFFNLDVSSDAVPEMKTEDKVKLWGERVSSGETAMIAAGYAAIPYPAEADVKTKVDDYKAKLIVQSTKMDATDAAQEAIDAQNEEADKVIKKVWDEVETFYNEETEESKRANARQWGVKYVTLGEISRLTFSAISSIDGKRLTEVKFKINSTGNIYNSDATDFVNAETRIVGEETVTAECEGFEVTEQKITIIEGQSLAVQFKLAPAAGHAVIS